MDREGTVPGQEIVQHGQKRGSAGEEPAAAIPQNLIAASTNTPRTRSFAARTKMLTANSIWLVRQASWRARRRRCTNLRASFESSSGISKPRIRTFRRSLRSLIEGPTGSLLDPRRHAPSSLPHGSGRAVLRGRPRGGRGRRTSRGPGAAVMLWPFAVRLTQNQPRATAQRLTPRPSRRRASQVRIVSAAHPFRADRLVRRAFVVRLRSASAIRLRWTPGGGSGLLPERSRRRGPCPRTSQPELLRSRR